MSSWSCPSLLVATAGRARSGRRSDRTGTGLLQQAPTKSLPRAWPCQVDSRPVDGSLRGQPESASRYFESDRAGEHPNPTSLPFAGGSGVALADHRVVEVGVVHDESCARHGLTLGQVEPLSLDVP